MTNRELLVMFGMYDLLDHEEKGKTTLLIGEGPDFIRLGPEFSKDRSRELVVRISEL